MILFSLGSLERHDATSQVCVHACTRMHTSEWGREHGYDAEGESKRKRFLCLPKFLIDYLTWHVGSGNLGN